MKIENYFTRGKEFSPKGKFHTFGLVMGIITLVALIGGLASMIVIPLVTEGNGISIVDSFKDIFESGKFAIIHGLLFVILIVCTAVYVILNCVKMFIKDIKNSGDIWILFTVGLAVLLYAGICDFTNVYPEVYGLGYKIMKIALLSAVILVAIYQGVSILCLAKKWEKQSKSNILPRIIFLLACIIAIVFGVAFAKIAGTEIDLNFYIDKRGTISPLATATAIVQTWYDIIIAGTVAFDAKIIFATLIMVSYVWLFVELGRLIFATLFSIVQFSFNKSYVRGSNYFSRTTPLKSAGRFVFIPFFIDVCEIFIQIIDGVGGQGFFEGIKTSFDIIGDAVSANIFNLIAFVVVLILCIIYYAINKADRKIALESGYVMPDEVVEPELEILPEVEEQPSTEEVLEEPTEVHDFTMEEEPEMEEDYIIEEVEEQPEEKPEEVKQEEKASEQTTPNANAQAGNVPPYPYMSYPYAYGQVPQQVMPNGQIPVMPYPYAGTPYPYPYAPMPYPYAVPYPMQNSTPTVICVPTYAPYPAQPQQPASEKPSEPERQQKKVVEKDFEEVEDFEVNEEEAESENFEEESQVRLNIVKKTLDEKFQELPALLKRYYRQFINYVDAKNGVKHKKTTNYEAAYFGRDCLVKMQIKQGKIVCSFSLLNYEVKSMLKTAKIAKERLTIVKIVDDKSYQAAKESADMAYKLAVESKEIRHQEQLKKRREARLLAKENAKSKAKAKSKK